VTDCTPIRHSRAGGNPVRAIHVGANGRSPLLKAGDCALTRVRDILPLLNMGADFCAQGVERDHHDGNGEQCRPCFIVFKQVDPLLQ